MKRILFVDDEPNVLNALKRMLHKMNGSWEMVFANNGKEALELLGKQRFDAIVSDMRMPEITGSQLLKKVKELHPGIVRFILSGHSDNELIMQSVGCTHQYLAKPCDPNLLVSTIENSFGLRELLADEELRNKIAEIPALPTLPETYTKLVSALGSDSTSIETVAKIVGTDIGMTAKVLHLVNSAFFGLPCRVDSTLRAVSFLGLETIKTLVLTVGIFEQFEVADIEGMSLEQIYSHSLAVGVTAQKVAQRLELEKRDIDDALMAGMTHDVGKPIMLIHFRDKLQSAIQLSRQKSIPLHQAERETLGVTHAEIGAYLLSLWGEQDPIVESVALHHRPSCNAQKTPNVLTAVHIANALQSRADFDDIEHWQATALDVVYLRELGIADRIPALAEQFAAEAAV